MAADEAFTIIDGVRRAKAAEKLGHQEVLAKVFENDVFLRMQTVPIARLYSPKPALETSSAGFARWRRILRAVENGVFDDGNLVPPIEVCEGAKGTPLADVLVEGVDDVNRFQEGT
jgi:hypothetical protein